MTASTSLAWAIDGITVVRPDDSRVCVAREIVTLDFSRAHAVPDGAVSLSAFLDDFETHPDVAPHLAAARVEVAREAGANGRKRLSHLRLARGWSQSELAERLGTSQSMVSLLERRIQKPTEDTIRDLSRVLDVDFNTLMDHLSDG